VHSGAICNSACTLIWLAGTYRHLDPKTRLGFHSAREKRDTLARFEEGNKKIAEYLTKLGIPQQLIDLQPKPTRVASITSDTPKPKRGAC
jgi:hypothetical protein